MSENQKRAAKSPPFSRSLRDGMIVLVIFGGFLTGIGIYFNLEAKYATILYHYNAEYRAGNQAVENAIINVAIPELIKMYDRHPDWPWTLELQAWAIVNMSLTNNGTIFKMLKNQINRGQCELITPLWSYQMLTAFTLDDVNVSLAITRETLRELNITRFPRVCFFQESQAFPGFGNAIFNGDLNDIVLPRSERTVERWFNTDAGFERNSQKQLGSNIRTFPLLLTGLRGDGFNSWDLSVLKDFKVTEKISCQFRAEAQDALNHAMFGGPNTSPTSSLFGQVTSTVGVGQRVVTLNGRVSW